MKNPSRRCPLELLARVPEGTLEDAQPDRVVEAPDGVDSSALRISSVRVSDTNTVESALTFTAVPQTFVMSQSFA